MMWTDWRGDHRRDRSSEEETRAATRLDVGGSSVGLGVEERCCKDRRGVREAMA